MGRCRLLLGCALAAALAAAPSSSARPQVSWAQPQIDAVVSAGVMDQDAAGFHPADPLTRRALETLVAGLTYTSAATPSSPAAQVTIAGLNARLVNALELSDTATLLQQAARSAGLAPPSRFGTEAVARLLGLRTNHPAAHDDLELLPNEIATRAEAAYSAAQILDFGGWETQAVRDAASTFTPPTLTPWQKRVLTVAVHFIGYPYVWGGESEFPESPLGHQAHGGFDCSGFVWRVYKIQQYASEGKLASVLRGRTTYDMSGEVAGSARITFTQLQPADVLFFGSRGSRSKPAEVGHMGIYLGNGWFIHSSGYGVAIAQLSGRYRTSFAWARRPLAEARLAS